jgi:hypothetical protein
MNPKTLFKEERKMTTNETKQHNRTSLKSYLEELAAGEAVPRLENETWEAMMARISGYRGKSSGFLSA